MMRDVIGPLPPLPGFARTGTLNPALCCYGRYGALDGLSFEGAGGNRVIVTTPGPVATLARPKAPTSGRPTTSRRPTCRSCSRRRPSICGAAHPTGRCRSWPTCRSASRTMPRRSALFLRRLGQAPTGLPCRSPRAARCIVSFFQARTKTSADCRLRCSAARRLSRLLGEAGQGSALVRGPAARSGRLRRHPSRVREGALGPRPLRRRACPGRRSCLRGSRRWRRCGGSGRRCSRRPSSPAAGAAPPSSSAW